MPRYRYNPRTLTTRRQRDLEREADAMARAAERLDALFERVPEKRQEPEPNESRSKEEKKA